jgi:hypothetical protein
MEGRALLQKQSSQPKVKANKRNEHRGQGEKQEAIANK